MVKKREKDKNTREIDKEKGDREKERDTKRREISIDLIICRHACHLIMTETAHNQFSQRLQYCAQLTHLNSLTSSNYVWFFFFF